MRHYSIQRISEFLEKRNISSDLVVDLKNLETKIKELFLGYGIKDSTLVIQIRNGDQEIFDEISKEYGVRIGEGAGGFWKAIIRQKKEEKELLLESDINVIPKYLCLEKNPKEAAKLLFRRIGEFKKRRRYKVFIKDESRYPIGKSRECYESIVGMLENFRCETLGMGINTFYKLIAEFILRSDGRKYYPFSLVFSRSDNFVSDEWIHRIQNTMVWFTDLVGKELDNTSIEEFSKELSKRKIRIDSLILNSKDWYCIVAIQRMSDRKEWTEEELLTRIEKFYKRRTKKVTPEMVLIDLASGYLDEVSSQTKESLKKTRLLSTVDLIKQEPWYEEWRKGLSKY